MPEELKKEDRSGLVILGVLVFVMFGVGIWQLRYHLFTEDRVKNELIAEIQKKIGTDGLNTDAYLANSETANSLAELQSRDTDADGVNDFQEQYIYTTSPYLSDSDSDTISDPDEIAAGTNPNCPEGESCTQERVNTNIDSVDAQAVFGNLNSTVTAQVSTAQLRAELIKAGVSEEELAKYSDAQLASLYTQYASSDVGQQSTIDAQAAAVRAMSIDEKKALLLQSGLDSKTISTLSNDQINALIEQAVQDAYTSMTNSNVNSSNTNASSQTNS